METLRLAFLGTPGFAVPTLTALLNFSAVEVVAVVCQPDKPAGRGNKIQAPPVKELALAMKVPVLQPESLSKSKEAIERLQALKPELLVMVAFGQILKKSILSLPPRGIVNLHGSLLPAYRGAAPINWAIINGDTETGVTTMYTEAGVDTGPMLLKRSMPIGPNMDAVELARELSIVGADLTVATLEKILDGSISPERQDDSEATFAPMLAKETGHIDWSWSAASIHNRVRGLVPWPGAFTEFRGATLKIWRSIVHEQSPFSGELAALPRRPGSISVSGGKVFVSCGQDRSSLLELLIVQPANKAKLDALAWLNGVRLTPEDCLGS